MTVPYQYRVDALFEWIAKVNGPAWGDVLDAGTGAHSLAWLATLPTRSLTALTVEDWRLGELPGIAPAARIVRGEWTDPALLHGESFDQVLVDYVIGAIDGHAPYFQYDYLARLRPHCRGSVYLVGLEPPPRDGSILDQICRVRDACILLAGHRMYREYPSELVRRWMEQAGMQVSDVRVFPNRVGARFINGQLDVARRKLPLFADRALASAMERQIEDLRSAALANGEQTWGADYVVVATAPAPSQGARNT
ncbi:MAG: class I SAM-dependent methyltransferase [Myxococcales bacterium]|nr:class I SAM-dependent methyltransferase [Myxococcales bacterium]